MMTRTDDVKNAGKAHDTGGTGFNNRMFIINKASGPTSFDVVTAVRRVTGLRKVGHTGTLDPLATGVLLVCTGIATRAVEHFMDLEKTYDFDVRLGIETSTLDAEGDVVRESPCPEVTEERARETAAAFVGDYELTPPRFSAVKKDGKRMYELARDGLEPDVPTRRVKIYDFDVLAVDLPHVRCRVRCSRGTYVRSLARDLGERLGAPAHISRLQRTAIGPFTITDAFPSEELTSDGVALLNGLDLTDALDFLPGVVISERSRRALLNGALPGSQDVIRTVGVIRETTPVRIMDEKGNLVAIGRRNAGEQRNRLNVVDSFRLYLQP